MSLRTNLRKGTPGLIVGVIGWFGAPYVKSKMEGTKLNGIPGMLDF